MTAQQARAIVYCSIGIIVALYVVGFVWAVRRNGRLRTVGQAPGILTLRDIGLDSLPA